MVGLNLTQQTGERSYVVTMGSTYNGLLWCPTARYKAGYGGNQIATRNADSVYWKGIAERLHIESDTSDPWQWRRIVFEFQGGFDIESIPFEKWGSFEPDIPGITPVPGTGGDLTNPVGLSGITRVNRTLEPLTSDELSVVYSRLFKGQRFVDWLDPTTARVDRGDLKVHSDTRIMMKSGNDAAIYRDIKRFLALNKTMSYNAQESGSLDVTASLCDNKSPMKDVFIFDLFSQPSLAPGNIQVSTTTTAYWHEKPGA